MNVLVEYRVVIDFLLCGLYLMSYEVICFEIGCVNDQRWSEEPHAKLFLSFPSFIISPYRTLTGFDHRGQHRARNDSVNSFDPSGMMNCVGLLL